MQLKAFIVRIWSDGGGHIGGHVNDPLTGERLVFRNWRELWQILSSGLDAPGENLPGAQPEEVFQDD